MDHYRVSLALTNDNNPPAKETFETWDAAARFALDTLDRINGGNRFDDGGARDIIRRARMQHTERFGVFPLYDETGDVRYVLTVAAVLPEDDLPSITPEVAEQLEKVRQDGSVNMMQIADVQFVADKLACYALVVFCQDVMELKRRGRAVAWMRALAAFPHLITA
jgi:hypothetical protein